MKGIEHLTENQIAGYRAGTFDALEAREIGRHLLKCEACRRSLPAPTFDDFWKAVMTERETEQDSTSEKSELSRHSIVSAVPKVFGQFRGFAWSGAALIVLFSFSLLIWLNAGRQSSEEREIAQTFHSNSTESNLARVESDEGIFPLPEQNSRNNKQVFSSDSNRPANSKSSQPSERQNNLSSSSQKDVSPNPATKVLKNKPENISSTRGVLPANCGGETSVETEIGLSGEAVTLKWKKIPNAIKYHLYISDDEEILIDEYETERETSYALKKPLDAAKTYQWKIIVTTEDGKTIVGDSQKFTAKSLRLNQSKSEKKKKQQIRCSQNN